MIGDAVRSMSADVGLNWELFKCRGLSIRPIGIGGYSVTAVKNRLSSPNHSIGDPAFRHLKYGFPIKIVSGMT